MTNQKILLYLSIFGILIGGQSCEKEEFNESNQVLAETAQPGSIITNADLNQLPMLIQKHLHNCNVIGQPRHYNVKMRGTGEFKQSVIEAGTIWTIHYI